MTAVRTPSTPARFDLAAFAATPLVAAPFDCLVVENFLDRAGLEAARADFPEITRAGLFPLSVLGYGPAFAALVDEIRSPAVTRAFSEKFGLDLSGHPIMITVRGRCREKDGRIHTDTETKVVTALLYLNEAWDRSAGRLRLLRGPDDLEDKIAEVPPNGGTLIAFRRADNSYHGHARYAGVRRYVMFNWMTSQAALTRELARHRLSARIKRRVPFL